MPERAAPAATLLLSAFAGETWGRRILAAVPPGSLALVTAEATGRQDGASNIDIAFMTREVTGKSSKNNPTPELTNFEAVLRRSPRLQWLQIHPAGAERALYTELRGRGVKVSSASGATSVTVAHSALGAIIGLNRRFPLLADAQPAVVGQFLDLGFDRVAKGRQSLLYPGFFTPGFGHFPQRDSAAQNLFERRARHHKRRCFGVKHPGPGVYQHQTLLRVKQGERAVLRQDVQSFF